MPNPATAVVASSVRAALLLSLASCDCFFSGPSAVEQSGIQPPPADTEIVLGVARAICDQPLRGSVEWTDTLIPCDYYEGQCSGLIWGGVCTFESRVMWRDHVRQTALAHELGHFCENTSDETTADAFAARVHNLAGF